MANGNILALRAQQQEALNKAEAALNAATSTNRAMTASESEQYETAMAKFRATGETLKRAEMLGNLHLLNNPERILAGAGEGPQRPHTQRGQAPMSTEYVDAFMTLVRSGGKHTPSALSEGFDSLFGGFALPSLPGMSAALYEGAGSAGGYATTVPTDDQIVPLGVPDLGVRSLARSIATRSDVKIPSQSTFSTAGIKAESGSSTNTFSESDPTLTQFTLSAYMIGLSHTVSWELLQDVGTFQSFSVSDLINAVDLAEDGYFVNGTGTSQPQGLIGNVGTGTGSAYALAGTSADAATLLNSTFDVQGQLKATYFPTAAWLMSRATGAALKKAQQVGTNLYAPVWTRDGGRDYLHGFPVSYSAAMPNLPTATTTGVNSILFGSFSDGYIIGDRGGSGTFIKILDQPAAVNGQTILLGYKRVDGRVRRSEAIQAISYSHS
jgi:HK97 family phage major capsid protein